MKIQVILESQKIPRHYHFAMSSLVKNALNVSNPKLVDSLYNYKDGRANKRQKPFTGYIRLNDYMFQEDEILINGNIHLHISSPDPELILYVYNGFIEQREFKYKGYHFRVSHVRILNEKLPKSGKVLCQTKSPIVIKNREGKFLDIDEPNYVKELNYISNEFMKHYEGRPLYKPLKFTPVLMDKKVVQLRHEAFRDLNPQQVLYVNAYEGSFILEGDPRDIRVLIQAGLGFRRAHFHGCIEFVHE